MYRRPVLTLCIVIIFHPKGSWRRRQVPTFGTTALGVHCIIYLYAGHGRTDAPHPQRPQVRSMSPHAASPASVALVLQGCRDLETGLKIWVCGGRCGEAWITGLSSIDSINSSVMHRQEFKNLHETLFTTYFMWCILRETWYYIWQNSAGLYYSANGRTCCYSSNAKVMVQFPGNSWITKN